MSISRHQFVFGTTNGVLLSVVVRLTHLLEWQRVEVHLQDKLLVDEFVAIYITDRNCNHMQDEIKLHGVFE